MFADDTNLTYANGDLKKLETEINEELLFKVWSWLVVNKLTLNVEKKLTISSFVHAKRLFLFFLFQSTVRNEK